MFDKLFHRAATVIHHRAAPFAAERQRFLEHSAMQGYTHSYLQRLAATLLMSAHEFNIGGGLRAGPQEIAAVTERIQQLHRNYSHCGDAPFYRKQFIQITTRWLRFLGLFIEPSAPSKPYAGKIQDFATWMQCEKGLSSYTIRNRCWHVDGFFRWLGVTGRRLEDLRLKDIDIFCGDLHAQGYSKVTIKIHVNAVRAFIRHAERRGWCKAGIADEVHGPHIYRYHELPTGPSWDEVRRLLDSLKMDDPVDIRDRAILMLFAIYGLRANEVATLRLEDIDWEHDQIRVPRPKRRRSQAYPLVPVVGHAILRYLRKVRQRCAYQEVFLKILAPHGPMTSKSLYCVVASRMKRLGIEAPHCGPHMLRHACAAHLLARGLSLKEIGDHLGHSSLNSTRIYAKVDLKGLHEVAAFDLGEVA